MSLRDKFDRFLEEDRIHCSKCLYEAHHSWGVDQALISIIFTGAAAELGIRE